MTNTEAIVDAATNSETFDVLEFVTNAKLPEDTVSVNTDYAAGMRLNKIFAAEAAREKNAKKGKKDSLSIGDDYDDVTDENEVNELYERLAATAITFKLRGLAPAARKAIQNNLRATLNYTEGAENPEYWEALNTKIVADTIQSVTNASCQTDPNKWTPERLAKLEEIAHPEEFSKLLIAALELNFATQLVEAKVNADFS